MDNLIFNITDEYVGERIDKYLSVQIQGKSRSFIQGLINDNNVNINGSSIKSNYKLRINDEVTVMLPEPIELNVTAEKIDINIVYEDEDVVVVNKDKGMVVHPAPGNYNVSENVEELELNSKEIHISEDKIENITEKVNSSEEMKEIKSFFANN